MAYVPRLNKPEETKMNKEEIEINLFSIIKYVGIGIGALVALILFLGSFYTVKSGYKGLELTFGKVSGVVGDGLHVKWPIITSVDKIDVRTKKAHKLCQAGSKDMQRVTTEVSVNFHLDQTKIKEIYTQTGIDVDDNIIEPRIQDIVKAITAHYSAEELVTKRDQVKDDIATLLKVEIGKYHIVIEAVQITDFKFSDGFNASIEAKQQAEQSALKAKNDLDRIKVEAEQRITQARAEAEAIKIQAEAVRAQGGQEYVQLKAVEKWDGSLPTYMGGNTPIPFIDVAK